MKFKIWVINGIVALFLIFINSVMDLLFPGESQFSIAETIILCFILWILINQYHTGEEPKK